MLEAALATCIHMTPRAYARTHGISLEDVEVSVAMDRTRPEETVFRYALILKGPLSPEDLERLHRTAAACPVKNTLSKPLMFEPAPPPAGCPPGLGRGHQPLKAPVARPPSRSGA
ncbi:MAG: hypothetical protein DIU84_08975 [Bacillota bacterium]|nr:hypothetical protein [Bacillota bacterium]REJ33334.1 MAG: hypothetical protein DIU84_08975 [Bacillota bacterium]